MIPRHFEGRGLTRAYSTNVFSVPSKKELPSRSLVDCVVTPSIYHRIIVIMQLEHAKALRNLTSLTIQ